MPSSGESMFFFGGRLERLLSDIRRIQAKIMNAKKNYRSLVDSLYSEIQPFETKPSEESRPDTEDAFIEELKILAEMIGHCVILGDSQILYKYAIKPIRKNPRVLSTPNHIESYISAFSEKYENAKSDSEKFYLGQLVSELKLIDAGNTEAA